jgi:hypothetical protein
MVVFVELLGLPGVKIICHQPKVNLCRCKIVLEWDQKKTNNDSKRPVSSSKRTHYIHERQGLSATFLVFLHQKKVKVLDHISVAPSSWLRVLNTRL